MEILRILLAVSALTLVGIVLGCAVIVFVEWWTRRKSSLATEQSACPDKLEPQAQRCTHQQWAWAQIPVCQTCLAFLPWPFPTTAVPNPTTEEQPTAQAMEPPLDMSSHSEIQDGSRRVVRLMPSGIPYLWLVEPSCALTEDT